MRRIKAPARRSGCQKSATCGRDFSQGGILGFHAEKSDGKRRNIYPRYAPGKAADGSVKERSKIPFMFSA
ncbi:MAG: hypothetical protein EOR45_26455 [Mesorhizobium sp.]|nr:MAG: hypothetical protein EOR45_26455 [Mesorhizobium sp.]